MMRPATRSGFSLLEILAVMSVLAAILGLGGDLLLTAMRADQVGAATLNDLGRHAELVDQFRADVAQASDAPDRLGEFTAGPTCLILHVGDSHVVYRWHDNTLDRTVRKEGNDTHRPIALDRENVTVEFSRLTEKPAVATVRVIVKPPRGMVRHMEISAALGGDLR